MFKKPLSLVRKPTKIISDANQRALKQAVQKRRMLAAAKVVLPSKAKPVITQMERMTELRIDRLRKKQ